jgi:type IV secretory pathway TrbF-like protein
VKRYVHRKYELPNYKKRERTPYEAYRDDWNDRIIGRKESHANQLRYNKYTSSTPTHANDGEQGRWDGS